MEKILLVEPDYTNKYPPVGLMKIATYHKQRGDSVIFYKGKAPYPMISKVDKVYITSLFTFYFDILVETVLHYQKFIQCDKIFVGGILATIMPNKLKEAIAPSNVITGQLIDSSVLGYKDNINIDLLPIDYDILDDTYYNYPTQDNFFAYTTRGCPRHCKFCAVSTLEPKFKYTNNLISQITEEKSLYGDKRNILLMDNNILFLKPKELKNITENLIKLGYEKDKKTFIPENEAIFFYKKFKNRLSNNNTTTVVIDKFINYLNTFKNKIKQQSLRLEFEEILNQIKTSTLRGDILLNNESFITDIIEKYRIKKPMQRYVDFNQGIDARLLTEENMSILSSLPLRPFRLAYDNIDCTEVYKKAFDIAYRFGVRHFSNYMLFNYDDSPDDFWQRAYQNILLYNQYKGLSSFSFPMKYAPIDSTDRSYIGKNWNKKYLSAMNIILNVTKGVIAREEGFFFRAYGKNEAEFHEILSMPNNFIKYRDLFENIGLTNAWRHEFYSLDSDGRKSLLKYLSGDTGDGNIPVPDKKILSYYSITKHQIEANTIRITDYL